MDLILSPEDAWLAAAYPWRIDLHGYVVFGKKMGGRCTIFYIHRIIKGAIKGQLVDHIDGNPLNNRRDNLRICTHAENMRNRRISKANKTGHKGVWQNKDGLFCAEIRSDGKKTRLGAYQTAEEAGHVYYAAAQRIHGAFARRH